MTPESNNHKNWQTEVQPFVQVSSSSPAAAGPMETRRDTREVTFSAIGIHEHKVILGDNPGGTTGGPPLALDWKAVGHFSFTVGDYEAHRPGPRRSVEALLLPEATRVDMLKEWGYTSQDIRQQCRPVYIDRARRQATRLRFANGQKTFDLSAWDLLFKLLTMGCHGQKKQDNSNRVDGGAIRGSKLCQAHDIVLHNNNNNKKEKKNSNTLPSKSAASLDLHHDTSNATTGTMETNVESTTTQET